MIDDSSIKTLIFAYYGDQHILVKCLMKNKKVEDFFTDEGLEILEMAFIKDDDEMISFFSDFDINGKKRKHEFEENIAKTKRLN